MSAVSNLKPSKKKHSENLQVPCDPEAREIAATAQLPPGKNFCLEGFLQARAGNHQSPWGEISFYLLRQ